MRVGPNPHLNPTPTPNPTPKPKPRRYQLPGGGFYLIRLIDDSEIRTERQALFKLRYDPVFGHADRWEDARRLWGKPVPWL